MSQNGKLLILTPKQRCSVNTDGKQWKISLINYSRPSA